MTTIAIVPFKGLDTGKRRLMPFLSPTARGRLSWLMLRHVIAAVQATSGIDAIWIVSSDQRAALDGCTLLTDRGVGLNRAVQDAVSRASGMAGTALILAADLPFANSWDLTAILTAAISSNVVIVPDRHGSGTNALALSPPGAVLPCFGPRSRTQHEELARLHKLSCNTLELADLGHDVDTPADFEALLDRLPLCFGFLRDSLAVVQ